VEVAVRISGRRNASPKRNARADAALQNRQDWGLCVESSDRYRQFARECLAMAQTIQDEGARAVLVQMAQAWLRLAERHNAEKEDQHD
jgi:hypothetical protein